MTKEREQEEQTVWLAAFGASAVRRSRYPRDDESQRTHDQWARRFAIEDANYALKLFRGVRRAQRGGR
jgi:hypothetical protein